MYRTLLFLFILFLSPWTLADALGSSSTKNIVVLLSSDQALPWSQRFIRSLNSEQHRLGENIDFYFESIDQQRLESRLNESQRATYLKQKYANKKIDAVIAESAQALSFVRSQGNYIFGIVPYVLINRQHVNVAQFPLAASVANSTWLAGNAALIKRLQPDVNKLVVVSGTEKMTAVINQELVLSLKEQFPQAVIRMSDQLLVDQLPQYISTLRGDTVIIYSRYARSSKGDRHLPSDIAQIITKAAKVPVYGLYEEYLGSGILGGNMLSAEVTGQEAFGAALQLIEQQKSFTVPAKELFSNVQIDSRAFNQQALNRALLPSNSQWLFETQTFYQQYLKETLIALAALFVLLMLLLVTSRQLRLKRRAEKQLFQHQQQLKQQIEVSTQELEQMAVTDALTGLLNRAEFYRKASGQMSRFVEQHRPCCLVMIDVDNLKQINDSFGHALGDQMIVHCANVFQKNLAKKELLGRVGGEEFAILLPESSLQSAAGRMRTLCQLMADSPLNREEGDAITATLSIGVTRVESDDFDETIKQANKLLYQAQAQGTNRVMVSLEQLSAGG